MVSPAELMWAAQYGHLAVVNKFLENEGTDVNQIGVFGWTALIEASNKGQLDVVNRLLECKEIDVNLQTKGGRTALIRASWHGHLDVANLLLDFQKTQIREGFELSYSHGSLYIPVDLIELIIGFTV